MNDLIESDAVITPLTKDSGSSATPDDLLISKLLEGTADEEEMSRMADFLLKSPENRMAMNLAAAALRTIKEPCKNK